MAYFLKKSNRKKGTYLQIYESFYHHEKKETAHRSYQALGYVEDLVASGIPDPVAHYSDIVKEMNKELSLIKQQEKVRQISASPERYLGYFPVKNLYDSLHVSNYLDFLQYNNDFRFRLSDLLEALTYSRIVQPCSKSKTLSDIIPKLYNKFSFSYDQILEGVEHLGLEYEKVIEIFNHQINLKYPSNTSTTYFDCTNFYFEIDKEDDFRRKGPSKEKRNDPIVGLGLLLDADQIPIGMKLYPGNESEKPVIREVIDSLKKRNNITGRTIQVADKGLNCGNNIVNALKSKDGYLFSKSVKQLPETEKTWLLLENDYKDIKDSSGNVLYRIKECIDDFTYIFDNPNGGKSSIKLTEKRVATYNPKLAEKKRYEINRLVEKARTLKACQAKRNEYGNCSKYVTFQTTDKKGKSTDDKIMVSLNQEAIDNDLKLAGYNLLVTSELKMNAVQIYSTYHNLWRIEESFRMMKSYLDARPVYLQKEDSIKGHFLICYIAVLLIRLLQFKVFHNKYCTETLIDFIRDFRVVKVAQNQYINITSSSETITELAADLALPLTNYHLNDSQIKKMLSHKF